ncbi:MAG: ClbS/DfsB family four-helix bundle protein [Methanomassiliicoccaceae archaeon]|jgi:hypothetical protein|nr:ClbS/DfsB family four-helix bundle protein [Methanomassiliicoccaceae archaeon]
MPRPTTKQDLLKAADEEFSRLWALMGSMTDEEQNTPFMFGDDPKRNEPHWKRDKNLRDVIVHLYEWHQMIMGWHNEGVIKGGIPAVPGEGYTWQTLPDLNQKIWEKYQSTPLKDAKEMLKGSHSEIITIATSHTEDELFRKGHYKWTKSTNLATYFISGTSSHYDWAIGKIKLHIKMIKR